MQPRSEHLQAGALRRPSLARIKQSCKTASACAPVFVRAAAILACAALFNLAQAQDAATLPDDEVLYDAIQYQADGHAWQAEAVLRRLAEAGNVVAMERLALMHWYGGTLYPGQAWSREVATRWFARASQLGSSLGRHMTQVAQRTTAQALAKP